MKIVGLQYVSIRRTVERHKIEIKKVIEVLSFQ